ncbi:MAM and LDL-receptor class A domain-containing protein 1-like [Pomacea canaliculata]|uniref:MAM and LDL-receptor class A domain-containing protein 1-like n=1 Tax=Pomacea canaliculata TaxID=400727 RepID=UPI000D737994|nr:MAM and LDL-receptor class A domain-containing protein 1-like [Pomacea canaliculata]
MEGRNTFLFYLACLVALSGSQSQYDCTFETGYCSWIQDTSNHWIRTQGTNRNGTSQPITDHTLGNKSGWYIETTVQGTNGTARLISPQISANSPYCLQFWYYMYGAHVNALSIYIYRDENLVIPLWTKSQTQGSQWNYGQVQLSSFSYSVNIVFEAVRGPFFKGDIGIDDIRAVAGSCPTTNGLVCDFEASLCGWNQTTADDFDWTIRTGQTSTVNTGPSTDHTLGTSSGHFLYIGTSTQQHIGQKALLVSSLVTQTTPQCMSFFYILSGDSVGALNIYIMSGAALTNSDVPVWSKRDSQGGTWVPGQATIQRPSSYRVVFEGVVGASSLADIAIDDIIVRNGSCSYQADNNFEHGLGIWTNPSVGDNFDWLLGQASMGATFSGPSSDHTLVTSEGHYLFVDFSNPVQVGDISWLQSPIMEPNVALCMSFWYITSFDGTNLIKVLKHPAVPTNSSSIKVWSIFDLPAPSWTYGRIAIFSNVPFYIIFEVSRGENDYGVIALDDISFTESVCMGQPQFAAPEYSLPPIPKLPTTTPVPSPYDCDFEQGLCQWIQDTSDDFDWILSVGTLSSQNTAPSFDHTFKNLTGHFLYIETSLPHRADTARLLSPQVDVNPSGACLRFWYIMYGPSVNSLNVYIHSDNSTAKVWTRTGTQENQWTFGETLITSYYRCQIIIEATRGTTFLGDIAIDDINFSNRPCTSADTVHLCDFEDKELCGFAQDKNDSFDWTWKTAGTDFIGPSVDHTEGTDTGHYMCIVSSAPQYPGQRARLISPIFPQTIGSCLTFYYYMCGFRKGMLVVYLAEMGPFTPYQVMFQKSGNQGCNWLLAEAQVQTTSSFQIYFDGIVGSSNLSDLAIDDVSLKPGVCQGDGGCDFENGLCTWTNARNIDQLDWMISEGGKSNKYMRPNKDHTFLSGEGHYLFIDPRKLPLPGLTAILQSQTFDATNTGCISFWYDLTGSKSSTLSVVMFTIPSNTTTVLWSLSGDDANGWVFASAPINSRNQHYQLWIQGSFDSSYFGNFAVDDITLMSSPCAVMPPIAGSATPRTVLTPTTTSNTAPVTTAATVYDCTFESDFCQWKQAVDDTFNWTRSQGPSGTQSAGPINDHTLRTGQGWFAFIAPLQTQKQNDTARLVSPQITDNAHRCLSFYYHMFGASVNLLNVYMKSSGQSHLGNLIWRRQGTQGLQWLHAKIQIKPVVSYQIIFENILGSRYSGDIAVDDITLPTGLCEVLFPESTTTATCDFESSSDPLCGFIQDRTDNFDWKQSNGSLGTTEAGPFEDHTYGSLAGHFIYTEKYFQHHEKDTARLISRMYTNPNSIQHCLRFYYLMQGSNIGMLNVYTTAQNQTLSAPIWTLSISQGYQWKQAKVTITIINNFQVIFEAVVGSTVSGYIAIDDITITAGACQDAASCDFEEDLCLWTNAYDGSDKFDWLRVQGSSSTQYVTPSADHTSGNSSGYFIFIETDPPRLHGDNARLVSQVFPASPDSAFCISFWFYMYGHYAGILTVLVVGNISHDTITTEAALWQLAGDRGEWWYHGVVSVSTDYTQKPFQVIFEGVIGKGFGGNIAVDDISIYPGDCDNQPDDSDSALSDLYCNFDEGDTCAWKQSTKDDFDWSIESHSTPAADTGPSKDHTGSGGYYVYLESSWPRKIGDKADLISSIMSPTEELGSSCFTFWYHMYGPVSGPLLFTQSSKTDYPCDGLALAHREINGNLSS